MCQAVSFFSDKVCQADKHQLSLDCAKNWEQLEELRNTGPTQKWRNSQPTRALEFCNANAGDSVVGGDKCFAPPGSGIIKHSF